MTGVLSNLSAVLSHARGFLPSFKTDLANMFDRAASPRVRVKAAGYLALAAAVMVVLAYAVKQEWQQHITSATEEARISSADLIHLYGFGFSLCRWIKGRISAHLSSAPPTRLAINFSRLRRLHELTFDLSHWPRLANHSAT
jgi:hypothetical protein